MFNRQKDYTSQILSYFLQQNFIIGMYIDLSAIISQSKISLDKPVFNTTSRLNHSFTINNTVTSKIKHFHQLFALCPLQIALKEKLYYFLSWSTITTKLDIHIYKYKKDYIRVCSFQLIALCSIHEKN